MPLRKRQGSRPEDGRQGSRSEDGRQSSRSEDGNRHSSRSDGSRKGSRPEDSRRQEDSRQRSRSEDGRRQEGGRQGSRPEDSRRPEGGRQGSRPEDGRQAGSRTDSGRQGSRPEDGRQTGSRADSGRKGSRPEDGKRSGSRTDSGRQGSRPEDGRRSGSRTDSGRQGSRPEDGWRGEGRKGSRPDEEGVLAIQDGEHSLRGLADASTEIIEYEYDPGEEDDVLSPYISEKAELKRKLSNIYEVGNEDMEEDEEAEEDEEEHEEDRTSNDQLAIGVPAEDDGLDMRVEAEQELLRQKIAVQNEIAARQAMMRARNVVDDDDESDDGSKKKRKDKFEYEDDESLSSDEDLARRGLMEANRTGVVPVLFGTVFWVLASSITLFLAMYVYKYQEAFKFEYQSAEGAATHARLHAGQLLYAAPAAARALETGFRTGALLTLSDYAGLLQVLKPHFLASPALIEVHLADADGSVVAFAERDENGTRVELRSERVGCETMQVSGGCTDEPLRATRSSWYKRARNMWVGEWWPAPLPSFWEGPTFRDVRPHDTTCSDICFATSYAYVARLGDGPVYIGDESGLEVETNKTFEKSRQRMTPVIMRAALDAKKLQEVVLSAKEKSKGEAFLCTAKGSLIAAEDWGEVLYVDGDTSELRARNMWELPRNWAYLATEAFVSEPPPSGSLLGATRVTAWRMDSHTNVTDGLGDVARIVMAVPQEGYIDTVLGPIVPFSLGVAGTPPGLLALASLVAAYFRYLRRSDLIQDENDR
eukprot:TRINITY_DN22117_c0_g1_i1.p1 TRINITY_DN22117_c0_g1~~TRINITY_DN22117_c0_g1_i1.p1  ORF type:complete len:761 (+),score=115.52 TRINITY_DN22117_c0_g1_i1:61-2343(+)